MAFIKYRGNTVAPGTWTANAAPNAPLSNTDIDKNFASLDAQKLDLAGGTLTGTLTASTYISASLKDDSVYFVDNADTSKKLGFQVSGVTAGSTVTLTVPDNNGTIALTSDTISATNGGTSITTYTTGDILYASAANTLSKLAVGNDGQFLKLVNGVPAWAADNNTTYTSSSFTYYIGTTTVQTSSGNKSLTGITGVKTDDTTGASAAMTVETGAGTAVSSSSGALNIKSGSTNGTIATGGSSGTVGIRTGNSGTSGAAGGITLEGGTTAGVGSNAGSIHLYGGWTSNGTSSDNGHIYIKAGVATASTGTKYGGKVWIDGGRPATGGTVVDEGTVNIGTVVGSAGDTGTMAINIGHSTSTTKVTGGVSLPSVGTSGFVKLSANGQLIADNNTYLTSYSDTLQSIASTTSAGTHYISFVTSASGAQTGLINTSITATPSTGTISATNFDSTSDIRFKSELETISNALDKVKTLTGCTFTMIETGQRSTGLIAQDVEKVLPEAVGGDENKKTINYGAMMGLIVESIKELNSKLEDIQNQLNNK